MFVRLLLLLVVLVSCPAPPVRAQVGIPRVVISAGGPYIARDTSIQQFHDSIDLPARYENRALSIVFTNGSMSALGYSWVRVFLQSGAVDQGTQASDQLSGRLLVDEHSFVGRTQVYLDLTGQLNRGENHLNIEGAGPAGAVLSWELRSVGAPEISPLNPRSTISGASLRLSGTGFSIRPEENTVHLGPVQIPVEKATFRAITVFIPPGFTPGSYSLNVQVGGYPSNAWKINVVAGPEVTGLEYTSVKPGQQLNVYGKNFSQTLAANQVYIGNQQAQLVGCSDSTITLIVPNLPAYPSLPVTVYVNGARAQGTPNIRVTR